MSHKELTAANRVTKLEAARAKYGKPFAHETPQQRRTEASHVLREILRRSEEEKLRRSNVLQIRRVNRD